MTMFDFPHRQNANVNSPAQRLQASFAAVRVSFAWFGTRKALTPGQKAQAAEPFGAEEKYFSGAKKLLDTGHPLFRDVTGIRSRVLSHWKAKTLPYPEPGVRLIKPQDIPGFDADLKVLKDELVHAVQHLDAQYETLRKAAREQLGGLYAETDYPPTLVGLFDLSWDFPSIEPPQYLLSLNPQLYEQEKNRISARFDEAARLAESAFIAEFAKLVSHLTERISGSGPEGKKVFRDGVIDNLHDFFSRFRNLNVGSNQQLDELVEMAQRAVKGIAPQDLRDSESVRQQVTTQLATVTATLDQLLIDAPRRKILRPVPPTAKVA